MNLPVCLKHDGTDWTKNSSKNVNKMVRLLIYTKIPVNFGWILWLLHGTAQITNTIHRLCQESVTDFQTARCCVTWSLPWSLPFSNLARIERYCFFVLNVYVVLICRRNVKVVTVQCKLQQLVQYSTWLKLFQIADRSMSNVATSHICAAAQHM